MDKLLKYVVSLWSFPFPQCFSTGSLAGRNSLSSSSSHHFVCHVSIRWAFGDYVSTLWVECVNAEEWNAMFARRRRRRKEKEEAEGWTTKRRVCSNTRAEKVRDRSALNVWIGRSMRGYYSHHPPTHIIIISNERPTRRGSSPFNNRLSCHLSVLTLSNTILQVMVNIHIMEITQGDRERD